MSLTLLEDGLRRVSRFSSERLGASRRYFARKRPLASYRAQARRMDKSVFQRSAVRLHEIRVQRFVHVLALGAVLASGLAVMATAAERPNIILCMSDDQGWGDVGYNGHPILKTPHLDRISREGVTFTRFYSAAAMCSPTRGSCYTGRHPYRFGITYAMKGMLEPTEIPITRILKQLGYTTGHFGKWHLGTLTNVKGEQNRWGDFSKDPERYFCPPWERDVDRCFVTESKVPTWNPLLDPGPIKTREGNASSAAGTTRTMAKPYGNDYFTGPAQTVTDNVSGDDSRVIMDRALPFMAEAASREQPFFAAIWFHTPHSPVVGGPEYLKMYADQPEPARHYYACLTAMDEQIGRLRAELETLGVAENTMLWFCADNGPARQGSPRHVGSAGGLSGFKLSIQEGGVRVPGLLIWPKRVAEPRTVAAPCVTTDYFPTILDALDVPLPADRVYDGISLLPLVTGQRRAREMPIGFLNKDGKESAWIEDRFKLIQTPKGRRLYDIVEDVAEKNDLSERFPEVVDRMQTALDHWRQGVMADLDAVPAAANARVPAR